MRLGVVFNPLWLYQLERMVLGNTKPSICYGAPAAVSQPVELNPFSTGAYHHKTKKSS